MPSSIVRQIAILSVVFCTVVATADEKPQPHPRVLYRLWEAIKKPLLGPAEALGAYSAGCLVGARALPLTGEGYQIMRPERGRYYGHPLLNSFILDQAKQNKVGGMDLLIGDMSRPRGGPTISGHVSHQTGLDVDVWYIQTKRRLSMKQRNVLTSPVLVKGDSVVKWQKQYSTVVQKMAEDSRVDRIFVNAAIKKQICKESPNAAWLAKLRPWWGHADHFHVRLKCPEGNARCQTQEPIDPGHIGCDSDLAWWFSQEAKDELAKRQAEIQSADRPFPHLPSECEKLALLTPRLKKVN